MANSFVRNIPNAVTCCNLLSGCIATSFALQGDFLLAFLFIIVGALFDFFDGMTARLLHVASPIGKELDSLADVVTFGVAPSMMVFSLLQTRCTYHILPYIAFLLAAFSALRLARFNLDERQTNSFIGLPTPANALFWGSLVVKLGIKNEELGFLGIRDMIAGKISLDNTSQFLVSHSSLLIIFLVILFSWLLVSPIPMFSLKFHNLRWKENRIRYIFLLGSIALLFILGIGGFAAIIGWYIILSLISQSAKK